MSSADLTATIDCGTTNTRVTVWRQARPVARAAAEVGVRDTGITGSTKTLIDGLRSAIEVAAGEVAAGEVAAGEAAVGDAAAALADLRLVLASGMITSDLGLMEIPHLAAPAGIAELAEAMVQATISDVVPVPIWFVPGIKNEAEPVEVATVDAMDMMRGEEVETIGIFAHLDLQGPALLVLPGSHSKFVGVDARNRITGCVTTLAGELLATITRQTIVAGSVKGSFADHIDEEMALHGAQVAARAGLNRACFCVRILERFTETPQSGLASFLAGAVVGTDLLAVKGTNASNLERGGPTIVGGTNQLAQLFELLIRHDPSFSKEIIRVDEAVMADAAGLGALAVAQRRGLVD